MTGRRPVRVRPDGLPRGPDRRPYIFTIQEILSVANVGVTCRTKGYPTPLGATVSRLHGISEGLWAKRGDGNALRISFRADLMTGGMMKYGNRSVIAAFSS